MENEVNVIQEKIFNGELVTHQKNQSEESLLLDNASCSIPTPACPPASSQDQHTKANQEQKAIRKVKPVGDTIIFGDSNTRGLARSRLAMGIGSLSSTTFDSVTSYLHSDPTPNDCQTCHLSSWH